MDIRPCLQERPVFIARNPSTTIVQARAAYTLPEAAGYMQLPLSTVQYWALGRGRSRPLVTIARKKRPVLVSFLNLAEFHLIAAIRRKYGISMPKVRKSINYLRRHSGGDEFARQFPLLGRSLETDGLDLFAEYYGSLVNISRAGQTEMKQVLARAMRRIKCDRQGIPVRLYPFVHGEKDDSMPIEINPRLSAGRPVIAGTGLAAEIIAERFMAGEEIEHLEKDYGRPGPEISEAIRYGVNVASCAA